MKKRITESGIRDISALRKRYPKAEIYFHQDLDGVTTAIAMKKYFEDNGIDVIDSHVIQYGDKEFAVKKLDATGDVMPVLVDFAHGKPMFVIHTDHHDRQAGAEYTKSTSFRPSRSNVATISQIVSPKDLFPSSDVLLINTVDSADFAKYDITPEEVVNYIFKFDKDKSLQKNKMLMGFVINKLLLAFKNKKGFLEDLVKNSEPSLLSILTNIKSWMKKTNAAKPEELQKNAEDYMQSMKGYPKVEDNIIFQYGGGSMMKPGSYDRYTPFKNNPEADFLIMAWPMGLVQASCNPFKKERELKGVNLGEIAQEVLSKWEPQLKERTIPLSTIKWVSETSATPESVGFTFKDFKALYGDKFTTMEGGEKILDHIHEIMETPFKDLSEEHKEMLDKIGINAWDLIQANSGGHKCITNISGLNYLGRGKRPPQGQYRYDSEKEDSPSVKFTKMIANEFGRKLKEKIEENKSSVNESKDYFKGSHFGDEEGNEFSVEKIYDFVKKNKEKYFHPRFPISKIKHNIEWWNKNYDIKNKEHKERMMNSDTSYPLLVVVEKGNNLSVADGLNRLYKAIEVEKKKTLPIYLVTKKEIENLKEKNSESK
jgi:disulfide oxidoreductase YuzD